MKQAECQNCSISIEHFNKKKKNGRTDEIGSEKETTIDELTECIGKKKIVVYRSHLHIYDIILLYRLYEALTERGEPYLFLEKNHEYFDVDEKNFSIVRSSICYFSTHKRSIVVSFCCFQNKIK